MTGIDYVYIKTCKAIDNRRKKERADKARYAKRFDCLKIEYHHLMPVQNSINTLSWHVEHLFDDSFTTMVPVEKWEHDIIHGKGKYNWKHGYTSQVNSNLINQARCVYGC